MANVTGHNLKVCGIWWGSLVGGGKSWLGCEWLLTQCYFYPGTKWFIGREELSRLKKSTFVTFTKVCAYHKIPDTDWKLNGQDNYIEFTNGSRIDLLDLAMKPSDPLYERYGSSEYTGGWIEEAGETNYMAFDVLKSRLGRHMNKEYEIKSKMLMTCNPKKNWLYKLVYKPFKEGTLDPKWAFIQSLYSDNPFTADEYGENLSEITDNATRQRLMHGNWEYDDDDNAMLTYDDIIDCFTNVAEHGNKYYVADIARYGGDRIVKGKWNGFHCYNISWNQKQGLDTTITQIRDDLINEQIPYSHCVVDDDGVGGGVTDMLGGVKGFVNNSSPMDIGGIKQNYQHLKAQCAYELARLIKLHKIKITVEDETTKNLIIEELEVLRRKDSDKDGKLKIIPKEEMKEVLGRSPDFLDMLIMRMYFQFKNTTVRPLSGGVLRDYK